jgi:hypothetical protein
VQHWGCRTNTTTKHNHSNTLESVTRAGESPVENESVRLVGILSTTRHVKSCGKLGGPPSKAQHFERPIVNKYREGKVKSTPRGG